MKGRHLTILVPVLARPHRVAPLLESALAATPEAEVLFIADPDDAPEIAALKEAGANFFTLDGGWAAKINEGICRTDRHLIFAGADDLGFHPGWYEIARKHIEAGAGVVGVNDLCSERVQHGLHATHFLLTRRYAGMPCADGQPGPLSTAYHHWWVDDEFIETARSRNEVVFATDAIVEHFHPQTRTAPDDATYRKGRLNHRADRRTFMKRRKLWKRPS